MMDPDSEFQVFNEDIEFKLKELGDLLGAQMLPGWGFTLLLFDFNKGKNGSMFYLSNGQREDVVAMMKEFIRLKEAEDENP